MTHPTCSSMGDKRRIYCWVCEEVNDGDEDGFCAKCGEDNVFSYTDAEIEAMYRPDADKKE